MLASVFWPIFLALPLLSLLAAPTGLFLVWNRSTTLSEGLGHAALLGFALHLIFPLPLVISLFLVNFSACFLQLFWKNISNVSFSYEGNLQVITAGFFSLGFFLLFKLGYGHKELEHALWGDLLGITSYDLVYLMILVFLVLLFLSLNFKQFISFLVDKELSKLEGMNVKWIEFKLWLFLATTITIGLRYFGALLLPSILTTPALLIQPHASSPEKALLLATMVSMLLVFLGLVFSVTTDFGISPSICIISATSLLFHSIYLKFFASCS